MSELTLKDLISLEEPAVEQINFRVVRHIMKGRGWQALMTYCGSMMTY